jgi:glycosyltransferase involved in cell wall biosynthesis
MLDLADPNKSLRACFFGTYDSEYPGNRVLIEGLRRNGVSVIECHVPLWETTPIKQAQYFGVLSLIQLGARFLVAIVKLVIQATRIPSCSVIITGFNGYLDLPLAKLIALFWRSKLVFNPMMSIYDTLVLDRKFFSEGSWRARLVLWLERALYKLPDALLVDSRVHYQFFVDKLNCPWSKFRQLPFGADDQLFSPRSSAQSDDHFQVLFYGKYQPLQGVKYIIEAAKQLEIDPSISFLLIGRGPTWPETERRARELQVENVEFLEWVDFGDLPEIIAQASVCLGIFGHSDKVKRCIANKVVQALAMRKPVITGFTEAMGEVLTDREHVLFCTPADGKALARAILELKQNSELRQRIADGGYSLFTQRFSPQAIGALAQTYLGDLISDN